MDCSGCVSCDSRGLEAITTGMDALRFTQPAFNLDNRTAEIVTDEMDRLQTTFGLRPTWFTVPGPVSFFDHRSQDIHFSEVALSQFQKGLMSERDLRELVAHEFGHALQFREGRLQSFPQVRELEARRWASDWVAGGEARWPLVDRPTPFRDAVTNVVERARSRSGG